ncbi:MAG: FAD-dependent oxidoreductase [Candidatus Dormiibacterota bacterium]
MTAPLVVVGGGPAAHGAVLGARQAGWDEEILLLGAEPDPPYDRTYLSKRYLTEDLPAEKIALPAPDATLRLGTPVVAIDPEAHEVTLEGGERVEYLRALLALGGRSRTLPGYESALLLRQRPDADRLREILGGTGPLRIVGAGFIGCEVAAAGRARGRDVSVREAQSQPLLRVLGDQLGGLVAALHREHGVDLRTGVTELPAPAADLVVAVGSTPNQELAAAAGIDCDGGILVDEVGRTSAPDVFAAGDCARFPNALLGARIRVEHFQTAQRHGRAVGRALAGPEAAEPFDQLPWFWTDQYDQQLQYLGAGLPWDDLAVRGDLAEPPFTAFQLAAGRIVGVLGWNDGRTITQVRRILERRLDVTVAQLTDPATDLRALARS